MFDARTRTGVGIAGALSLGLLAGCQVSTGDDDEGGGYTSVATDPPATDAPPTEEPGTPTATPRPEATPTEEPEPTEEPATPEPVERKLTFEALRRDGTALGTSVYRITPVNGGGEEIVGFTRLDYSAEMPFQAVTRTNAALDVGGRLIDAVVEQEVTVGGATLNRAFEINGTTGVVRVHRSGYVVDWSVETQGLPLALWSWESDPFFRMSLPDIGLAHIAASAKEFSRAEPLLAQPDFFAVDETIGGNGPCYTTTERFCMGTDGFIDTLTLGDVGLTFERARQPGDEEEGPSLPTSELVRGLVECPLPEGTVTVETRVNTDDGLTLAVQYDHPAGDGPFRTVAFMSDTGGADRDWWSGGAPMARCLAAELLEEGIATVRFDDRGFGESSGSVDGTTFNDRTADLRVVLANAQAQPFVLASQIVVLGLGEGAHHAALNVGGGKIAAIGAVGAFAGTGAQAWIERSESFLTEAQFPAEYITTYMTERELILTQVEEGNFTGTELDGLSVEYWEQYFAFDAASVWPSVTKPVLVMHGSEDWEVDAAHAATLKGLVNGSSGSGVTLKTLSGLGHHMSEPMDNFNTGQEYYLPFAWQKAAEDQVVDWVKALPF